MLVIRNLSHSLSCPSITLLLFCEKAHIDRQPLVYLFFNLISVLSFKYFWPSFGILRSAIFLILRQWWVLCRIFHFRGATVPSPTNSPSYWEESRNPLLQVLSWLFGACCHGILTCDRKIGFLPPIPVLCSYSRGGVHCRSICIVYTVIPSAKY